MIPENMAGNTREKMIVPALICMVYNAELRESKVVK